MKKIRDSYSIYLKPIKLFKDDVEEIISSLIDSDMTEIVIQDGVSEYEVKEFFSSNLDKPNNIDVIARSPFYFSVEINKRDIRIYSAICSNHAVGAVHKIEAILRSKKKINVFKMDAIAALIGARRF